MPRLVGFQRLRTLGDERFMYLVGELMRGATAMALARKVQQEWGQFPEVSEKTLTQQINRLRLAAAEGMFGPRVGKLVFKDGEKPKLGVLATVNIDNMQKLVWAIETYEKRILKLLQQEEENPKNTTLRGSINLMFSEYIKFLEVSQKFKFNLGMDEFKGPLPSVKMRGASATTTLPDGSTTQKQVFEAVAAMEKIFQEAENGANPQLPQ